MERRDVFRASEEGAFLFITRATERPTFVQLFQLGGRTAYIDGEISRSQAALIRKQFPGRIYGRYASMRILHCTIAESKCRDRTNTQ